MQTNFQNNSTNPNKTPFGGFFGEMTTAKASGLAFSLSAFLPAILSFLFLFVIAALGFTKTEGYEHSDWYLYAAYTIPQLSFALVALVYLRTQNTPVKTALKKQKCKLKYFALALLLQIGLFSLSELNGLFLEFLKRFGYQDSGIELPSMDGVGFFGVLFVVAVLPAVFEEIFFRGVLLEGLKHFSTAKTVLLCGALFSLYHQNPAQTAYQFCCGAAFALVAIRSGSILPTVLAHFFNNALILILTKFSITQFPLPALVAILTVSAFCLVTSLAYLIFIDKNPTQSEDKSEPQIELKSERKSFWRAASAGIALCALTWFFNLLGGM